MDVRDLTRSDSRGRSALHDEQSSPRNQTWLHKPEFTCESHDRSIDATEEKINPGGFQKSTTLNLSPSAAPESTGAVLGLFYFQKTKGKNYVTQ